MVCSGSQGVVARRFSSGSSAKVPDDLVVEEPLAIQLDDIRVSSTMRTPGHDVELAAGFCLTEGVLHGAAIVDIRHCPDGTDPSQRTSSATNVVAVSTGGVAPAPTPRLGSTSSSCGICGVDAIGELVDRLSPLPPYAPWEPGVLLAMPDRARRRQDLFERTGASHAAVAFDRGSDIVVVREDIGRHNAVDKVIGHLLLAGALPATDLALMVSGRASFEMVQKAWAAGFSALVAVSGPSSLAVSTARSAGLTLAAFARGGEGSIYSPVSSI